MNRLQYETSPYLLQHKDNPVDWYAWGDEAMKKSQAEDKPILLSIGYSACHWCHVMEHESFENPEIALVMNENFVNIKVDREERPDIDNIYMNFVQMSTGSGGWPLTVFLTPDLIPFYGGTYFPPEDKFGRTGFLKLLTTLSKIYRTRKDEILAQNSEVIDVLKNVNNLTKDDNKLSFDDFKKAYLNIKGSYDKVWGGFGSAPKFPGAATHMFLLRHYTKTGNNEALEMVKNTLAKMASGGMYDQIGGGFHRYSTDEKWLVPHFEKMLYDNALLARTYLEAYQVTKDSFFLDVAEDIFAYVMREMTDNSGGFYSSQDADSEGEEGKYFLWKLEELPAILDTDEINLAIKVFNITSAGNFESSNILTSTYLQIRNGNTLNLEVNDLEEKIKIIKNKMFSAREKRVKPLLDDKILTSWSALMINAFTLGYATTGKKEYLNTAVKCSDFIWDKCFKDNILYHSYKKGELKFSGYLDDYSFVIEAYISLYEVTFDEKWLERAQILNSLLISKFYDAENKDFYYSPSENQDLIVRVKELYDNALPSGNSSAVYILSKLGIYLNNQDYLKIALDNINSLSEHLINYPLSFSYILCAAYFNLVKPKEVAVITKDNDILNEVRFKLQNEFLPFMVLSMKTTDKNSDLELLKDKNLLHETATYYICQNYTCKAPIHDFEEAIREIRKY